MQFCWWQGHLRTYFSKDRLDVLPRLGGCLAPHQTLLFRIFLRLLLRHLPQIGCEVELVAAEVDQNVGVCLTLQFSDP